MIAKMSKKTIGVLGILLLLIQAGSFAGGRTQATDVRQITVYSGRGESLVQPIIERFEQMTGIQVQVRYGGTSELVVLMAEEGNRTPADVFWAQDGGALGFMAQAGRFSPLPATITQQVPELYIGQNRTWVATSGRARVLAYSPQRTNAAEHPTSIFDLTDSRFAGRVGWAPTNGSLQSHITAMRVTYGDDVTLQWMEAMARNNTQVYRNNTALVEAIAAGEIDYAITNNYYLLRFLAQDPQYPVRQRFFADKDIGNLVNVAGVGILRTSQRTELAQEFVKFLLSEYAQGLFTNTIYEYPVVPSVPASPALESFQQVLLSAPDVAIGDIYDLEGTLALMRRAGIL